MGKRKFVARRCTKNSQESQNTNVLGREDDEHVESDVENEVAVAIQTTSSIESDVGIEIDDIQQAKCAKECGIISTPKKNKGKIQLQTN